MDDTFSNAWRMRSLSLSFAGLLALSAASCSSFEGTTAASFLQRARSPDPNIRYRAYVNLASPNCYDNAEQLAEAVRTLVDKLENGREPVATRAVICRTLGELRDKAARPALLRAVDDSEGLIRAEACRAVGKVGLPEDAPVLTRIMALDTLLDCKVAALDALAELRPDDLRVLQVLVEGMDNDFPAIRLGSLQALRSITQQDLGVETGPWKKYVDGLLAARLSAPTDRPETAAAAPTESRAR